MRIPLTVTAAVIILALVILGPTVTGLRFVDAGEIGVVTHWGAVTGRTLDPGAHWVIPFAESVLKYDTKLVIYETRKEGEAQEYDDSYDEESSVYIDYPVDTNTKDGQQVNIYYTVRFSVDPTKASWIAQNIGSEDALVGKIVKTESRIWARNVPREYEAAQLYSGSTQEVQLKIAEKLKPVFEANGITLDEVGVREIQFSDQYIGAIEAKQIEAVKVETEQNKAAQAKFQKEAAITQAEAQAQSQRLQQDTLTEPLLRKLYLEKWDGALPTYMLGNGEGLILNLTQ